MTTEEEKGNILTKFEEELDSFLRLFFLIGMIFKTLKRSAYFISNHTLEDCNGKGCSRNMFNGSKKIKKPLVHVAEHTFFFFIIIFVAAYKRADKITMKNIQQFDFQITMQNSTRVDTCVQRKTPVRLRSITSCHCDFFIRINNVSRVIPEIIIISSQENKMMKFKEGKGQKCQLLITCIIY